MFREYPSAPGVQGSFHSEERRSLLCGLKESSPENGSEKTSMIYLKKFEVSVVESIGIMNLNFLEQDFGNTCWTQSSSKSQILLDF